MKWVFVPLCTLFFGGWLALAMLSYLGTSMVCVAQMLNVRTGWFGLGSADEYPSFHRVAVYRGYTLIAFTRTPYDPAPNVPFRSEWIFRVVSPISFSLLSPIDPTGQGFAAKMGSRPSENDGFYMSVSGERAGPASITFDAYLLLPPWFTFAASGLGFAGTTAFWMIPFLRVRPKLRRVAVSVLGVAIGIVCCAWLVWATVWYSRGSTVSLSLAGDAVPASGLTPGYHPWCGSLAVFTRSGDVLLSVAAVEKLTLAASQPHIDFGLEISPSLWRTLIPGTEGLWGGFGFSSNTNASMGSGEVRARYGATVIKETRSIRTVGLVIPAWFGYSTSICGLILSLGLPVVSRRKAMRRDPLTRPCPHCGYDLRATPTRCPECGHETSE